MRLYISAGAATKPGRVAELPPPLLSLCFKKGGDRIDSA